MSLVWVFGTIEVRIGEVIMAIQFRKVDKSEFYKVYEVIEKAFPLSEYRTFDEQMVLMELPYFNAMLIEAENALVGILIEWELEHAIYLEHLAVNPEIRGKGLGSILMREYLSKSANNIVLEVEDIDTEIAQRRIGFYERLGFTLSNISFKQPQFEGRDEETVNLRIMHYPNNISNDELLKIKEEILQKVYFQ